MTPLVRSMAPLFFALCILEAREAAADLPPPFCTTEGAACRLTGVFPGGVCKPGMCTRPGGAGAAGSGVISYDCLVCVNPHGGAGGSGAAGGGSGGSGAAGGRNAAAGEGGTSGEGGASGASGMEGAAGDAGANGAAGANGDAGANSAGGSNGAGGSGGSVGAADDGGCSCSLRALGSERGVAALMLGLGFLALRISRRRQ